MIKDRTLPLNCTFVESDWRILASHWYPIAESITVGVEPIKAMLLDEPLVVYRIGEELIVARDVCPHRGVPLSMGKSDGQGVVCPYHGLRFGHGGKCNKVPASPNGSIPSRMQLYTYPAVERYGLIWTCLDPQNDQVDIPNMPHWEDAGFQQIVCPAFDVKAFAGRQLEGFLDVAHFGFVHTDTFGNPNNVEVPAYRPEETPLGFEVRYLSTVANYPIGVEADIPADFIWLRHFEVHLPFTATLTVHFPNVGRLVIMNAASPVSAKYTRMFAPIARNFDKHIPVEDVHSFNFQVFEEDRLIVEAQKPERLPLDPSLEVHIPADMSSIAYRKGLRSQGLSQFFLS
ncbi:aromatic ring-hydroxylating oxygenase subunit alpha [Pseudomonas putida]|uniref:aromatic ring-hydroxylating oxygenase subunit alpha n=1 Tax=Pseudomonas putida TaxID=303 RepID=UPI0018DA1E5A|nr:aromatic ring-hydroxylating dioxygenase subunit alpha [Pseudomonas putida]MBH3351194.1 aromatic ring-hydroxylating dioxygenase subunit alpha [Pseudomonas putida]